MNKKSKKDLDRLADPFIALKAIKEALQSKGPDAHRLAAIDSIMTVFSTAVEMKRAMGKSIYVGAYSR